MFAALGLHVDELQRRRYGPLSDGELAAGEWRELTAEEVDALRRAAEHVETCVGGEPVEEGVSLAAGERAEAMPEGPVEAAPSDPGEEEPDEGAGGDAAVEGLQQGEDLVGPVADVGEQGGLGPDAPEDDEEAASPPAR
jgi:hypothetical protein